MNTGSAEFDAQFGGDTKSYYMGGGVSGGDVDTTGSADGSNAPGNATANDSAGDTSPPASGTPDNASPSTSGSAAQSQNPLSPIVVTAQYQPEAEITVTAQSTKSSFSGFKLPSFSEMYSALNWPRFYLNTAKEFVGKIALHYGSKLLPASWAASVDTGMSVLAVASIPLYEAATASDAENDFFYGGFGIPGAVDNLPVNLPGSAGRGVDMGGGVYWTEDYYGQN